ncbi:MAG TPA: hypothetical protein P5137_14715, partial [Candidatus Brocadiia bacterium]|nr:hypothetical protein [Candidatus Brocadiia bacterium]
MPPKTLHLVPQFHYDVEFLLPLEPYLEACYENLLEAHRLLTLYPDYTYLVEQVFLMESFLAEYPSLLPDFKKAAAEGRFEMASGMYTMADQNMPSGESLIRQLVVGKRWCQETLGLSPRVFNAGDCTGAGAQFPQIMRHCGYDSYVFMRAVDEPTRKAEILWRGLDGSEVNAYWLAAGYSGWIPPIFTPIPPADGRRETPDEAAGKVLAHALSDHALLPHGGDFVYPNETTPATVERWNREHTDSRMEFSTFARGLAKMDWSKAVPFAGEWNPDRTGCYSSRIRIKQENRACESLLRTAEAASALASLRLGIAPDSDGLLRAWKMTFINQFHDTIWGTVCDDAHKAALSRAKRVRVVTQRLIEHRLKALYDAQTPAPRGRALLVFNPLPWPRTADIALPANGSALGQNLAASPDFAFGQTLRVELPACGYRVVEVKPAAGAAAFRALPRPGGGVDVETPIYRCAVAPSGVISSLVRRRDGLEFVDTDRPWFNALCLQSDRGDLWQYYEAPMSDGGPRGWASEIVDDPYPEGIILSKNGSRRIGWAMDNRRSAAESIEVAENSGERLALVVRGAWRPYWPHFREFKIAGVNLEYELRITFHAGSPRVDFHLRTHHLRGAWYRLRAAFFTDMRQEKALHEIPFGRWQRPAGEFAAQNYMALAGKDKGLAVLNRGLPGNNTTDGVMMLALMRSVDIGIRVDSGMALEKGSRHVFDYAIIPFGGEKELAAMNLAREGAEFANPPYVYEPHPDRLPLKASAPCPASDELLRVEPAS